MKKYSNEQMFKLNSESNPTSIRNRLKSLKSFEHKCSICKNTEWMGKPIPLVMDHINGNRYDHRFENLRFICANCDHQLPTFTGRNVKIKNKIADEQIANLIKKNLSNVQIMFKLKIRAYGRIKKLRKKLKIESPYKRTKQLILNKCIDCGCVIGKKAKRCVECKCKHISDSKFTTTKDELQKLISTMSNEAVGRYFGVSVASIRQRCKRFGIDCRRIKALDTV